MLADVASQQNVVKIGNADDIVAAKQQGNIGFMPTLEHLAIGNRMERVDALFGMGVRLAGITYNRKNFIGDGLNERNPGGLSNFGIEVVHRMNDLGMAVDLSHASMPTALDAIEFSSAGGFQSQRSLHAASERAYPKGRGATCLRPERRTDLHHRGAQLA
jgi:membrane dipeptidase